MTNTLYRKVGRRYVPAGSNVHMYCDGVWLVYRSPGIRQQSCVLLADEPCRIPHIGYAQYLDAIAQIIVEHRTKSAHDAAVAIAEYLATVTAPKRDEA